MEKYLIQSKNKSYIELERAKHFIYRNMQC